MDEGIGHGAPDGSIYLGRHETPTSYFEDARRLGKGITSLGVMVNPWPKPYSQKTLHTFLRK